MKYDQNHTQHRSVWSLQQAGTSNTASNRRELYTRPKKSRAELGTQAIEKRQARRKPQANRGRARRAQGAPSSREDRPRVHASAVGSNHHSRMATRMAARLTTSGVHERCLLSLGCDRQLQQEARSKFPLTLRSGARAHLAPKPWTVDQTGTGGR